MDFIGVTQTEVTLRVSHVPGPRVLMSGPRCKVDEVKRALVSALDRLLSDTLVLDGPGAQRYFQAEGKVSKELIERSCKVFITAKKGEQRLEVSNASSQASSTGRNRAHHLLTQRYHHVFARLRDTRLRHGQDQRNQGKDQTPSSVTVSVNLRHGVKLQLVFGDITDETTDAVVNSTNFKDFHTGVCNAILSVAGRHLETSLNSAKVKEGAVFITPPGSFPCKSIFHVHGRGNTSVIEQLVHGVIQQCESHQYRSVAIPAICAGRARMDPDTVAHTILQAIQIATSSGPLLHLANIRIVLIEAQLFSIFKQHLAQVIPALVTSAESFRQRREKSVFFLLGFSRAEVDCAKGKVSDLYQAHCSTQTFPEEDLEHLTEADVASVKELLRTEALHAQEDGQGGLTVSGLKDGVNKVVQMLQTTITLRREMEMKKEEENRYALVTWCIVGNGGRWESLPREASCDLEKGNVANGIVDKRAKQWWVDVQRMEARTKGETTKLKRLENRADFTLPLEWDNMSTKENLKVVQLQPNSAEYRSVLDPFRQTANNHVIKVERLQNVHLRHAYQVQERHISEKNEGRGAGERWLYHGTSRETCDSIMNNGFNRSFSGKNGTSLGHGTYFAVNAGYSVSYSKPGADGSQTMFLARVLTGSYTQGNSTLRCPPNRNSHQLYDSVVDKTDKPNMFVVFNDNQAYPEYLITFQ